MKKEFEIQFIRSNIPQEEAENRLSKVLSMLINLDDTYEQKDNLQSVLSD